VPADDPRCKVAVWRYTGRFEDRGVPFRLTQMSTTDVAYMDEIAESIDHIDLEDDPSMFAAPHLDISDLNLADIHFNTSGVSLLSTQGLCYDSESTGATGGDGKELTCPQLRNFCSRYDWVQRICPVSCGKCSREGAWLSCYPGSCGPGSPWKKEGDIVVVDYYFSGIAESDTRRNAFRQAAKMWEDKTCINFVEGQQKPANRGCIKVTVTNEGSCSANVGYPGDGGEGTINLGWCKDSRHIGSIAHEIGHAIGMYHEQNRPDGPKAYRTPAGTKGPYLNVFWGNIASNWVSQYTPRDNSYIGSVTAGYAEYDYSAIMHYGAGNAFETVNPLFRNVPGQRSELSKGDIEQFEDMYQCRSGGDGSSPTPTPTTTAIITTTTTTTTTTSTGGDVTCTDDSSYRGPWGDSCANWQTWMESGQYQCSQYARWAPKLLSSCRAACKTCDATTTNTTTTTTAITTTTTSTEVALWPQLGADHSMCTSDNVFRVADRRACQNEAIAAGHAYYQFRNKRCATTSVCDSPITNTKKPWAIYSQGTPTQAPSPSPTRSPTPSTTPSPTTSPTTVALWPQLGADHSMCTSDNVFRVADRRACQNEAIAAGHAYYQFRNKRCATTSVCDSPITNTKKPWAIYSQGTPTQAASMQAGAMQ